MIGTNSRSPHPLKSTFSRISQSSTKHWQKIKNIWQTPQHLITSICAAVSEIIFLRGAGIGAILIAAMMLQPSVLIMGMTGLFSAIALAAVMQLKRDYLNYAPLLFNPLLAGLGVGYLFQITPASLILAGIAGSLAFVLTWTASHILRTFLLLPVLSLPFVAVSWIVHLAAFRYAGLIPSIAHPQTYSIGLPEFIEGFLRTLGLIFFLPNIYVGIAVMLLLLWNSRIQFVLAIAGYALGTHIRAILTGTFIYVYHDPAALNFILVALAIGGFYLIPSPRSYCLAAIAVVFTALISESVSVFWAAVGLPVHAFPYNLVTLSFLYLLGSVGQKLLARYPQSSPERTLDYELTARIREQGNYRAIALPFIGRWKVWQGVDGRWTHQGLWRYAYDFVLCDDEGQNYRNQGTKLTDYYAFQKPILSPISGWVTRVVSDLPDCAIDEVDRDHNWGNHVILYDDRGFYVEISHFAQNSIAVKQGDRLNQGTLLGRCGNSGYSPQPHIHIQAQFTPELGAATIPFSFTNLLVNDQFVADSEPNENDILEAIPIDRQCSQILSLTLDSQLHFQIEHKTRHHKSKIVRLSVIVKMAIDGTFYLDSGKAKLYFTQSDRGLKFHRIEGNDRHLSLLFLAMPSLPAVNKIGRSWQDYLPISIATKGFQQMSYQLMSSFDPRLASALYQGEWRSASEISGVVSIRGNRRKIYSIVNFNCDEDLIIITINETGTGSAQ
jgi:urea transporter